MMTEKHLGQQRFNRNGPLKKSVNQTLRVAYSCEYIAALAFQINIESHNALTLGFRRNRRHRLTQVLVGALTGEAGSRYLRDRL